MNGRGTIDVTIISDHHQGTIVTDSAVHFDAYRTTPARLALAGAAAIIVAILANVAIYLVARAVDFIPDDLPPEGEGIGVGAIVVVTILTLTVATICLGLFARFSKNPIRNFTILTVIVFVTSIQAPRGIEGAKPQLVLSLMLMHIATAAVAWWVLTRLSRVD